MKDIIYTKYRWFILVSLCVVQGIGVMALVSPATMIGEISETMGINMGSATMITMVVINIFIGISAFMGGGIADRLGDYRVWAGCSVLFILGTMLVPFIGNTIWGMLLIRLIHGFGAGPVMSTAPLVAAQWFPPQERGIVMGIQGALVPLGAIISLNLVPFVFQKTGSWQAALTWLTLFFILMLVLSIIVAMGPKPPVKEAVTSPYTAQASEGDIKQAYKLPATWAAIICGMCFSWVVRIINDVITNYLAVDPPVGIGLGPAGAGGVMSGVNGVFTITAIASGFILEKIFRGRLRALAMIGFILPAVLWLSIKYSFVYSNIFMLSAFMWAGAFGIALTSPLIMTFFAKYYPEGIMGKLGGLMVVFNQTGILIGTGLGSYTLTLTGRYDMAINLVGAASFLGFLSAVMLKEPAVFSKER